MKKEYFIYLCFGFVMFLIMNSLAKINKTETERNHNRYSIKEIKKIKLLAEKGDPESQNKIGWMYDQGIGFKEDTKKAIKWYLKSANQGFQKAKLNLGAMYELGRGVNQNYEQARKWYSSVAK